MSQFDNKRAAALKYEGTEKAPIIVASGSGYVADKIVEVAQENKVPIYQDNSLATLLSQLQTGREVPPELYKAIVDIYVYFLKYNMPENQTISSKSSGETSFNLQQSEENEIVNSSENNNIKQGQHIDISVTD